MNNKVKFLDANLTYIPMNKPGLTVEEVETTIKKYQEDRMMFNSRGYDLLVVDYPAKLVTSMALKGNLQKRENDAIVYGRFEQLGLHYGFHSLLAIQSNREGSKINARKNQDARLLRKEDMAESFGPSHIATHIFTINRDPDAIMNNYVIYYIDKARHGGKEGAAIICKSDYERCKSHGNELGSTYYMGTSSYAEKTLAILDTFRDRYADHNELQKIKNNDLK